MPSMSGSTLMRELCFFFLFLDWFLVSRSEKKRESRCRCHRRYGGFTVWVVGGFPDTSRWFRHCLRRGVEKDYLQMVLTGGGF